VSVIRDSGGFVTQRVVATIVNIAATSASRHAAPKDLETAVTLGLGYPLGPLAMGDRWGPTNILEVLFNMQTVYGDTRYRPSPWLRRRGRHRPEPDPRRRKLNSPPPANPHARTTASTSEGQTLVLTLSNPELRNAIEPAMYAAGIEALNVAESSPDVRSVVITGAGGMFCSGGNLQRLQANRQQPPEVQAQSIEGLHSWIETIRTYPKPVIAAVEGAAAGAGFSLALACDLVVAARNAVFVMAYSNVALSPDGGASWSLAQALPRQLATEILMCGDRSPPSACTHWAWSTA
jgi:hypothetical protein